MLFRACSQKKAADPSAAWTDLMSASEGAATTVDEQTTPGVQPLIRNTFVEESAFKNYYKGNKDYESWFNKMVPAAIKGEQKIGYWVEGSSMSIWTGTPSFNNL